MSIEEVYEEAIKTFPATTVDTDEATETFYRGIKIVRDEDGIRFYDTTRGGDTYAEFDSREYATMCVYGWRQGLLRVKMNNYKHRLELLEATLSLSNVKHVDGLNYGEMAKYCKRSAVNWMPYDVSFEFNKSCCPLKLMDGIACGRAIVSADIPECRLYPDWIKIYGSADEAVKLLTDAIEQPKYCNSKQIEFAKSNTWQARAEKIIEVID